ncbi:glycosyl transferase-like sugar-binding protein [Aliiruegeria haliotis]|uniref:Glycosyl transferase-like sugar-binding protein n=1 Tax=Aliiruegeria haliotis TaxID=1280846 RepID=A0A2T0RXN3_9RHOB|nr:glycosyltransferase [Aliiruegeria haliotis]PRY25949.1 glycosyl transferase-like sugar-binding protein [Aliiruegeria haliotis]
MAGSASALVGQPEGRNIFYYWDDPSQVPPRFMANIRIARAMNYDWDVHLLGDDVVETEIAAFDPELLAQYRRIRIPACRSDIARLVLLYRHGGWYLDADIEPRKALDIFGVGKPVLFWRDDADADGFGRVTNMAMYLPKGHSLALDALKVLRGYIREEVNLHSVFRLSGPGLITAVAERNGVAEDDLHSFLKHFRGGFATFRPTSHETSSSWILLQAFGIFDGTKPSYPAFPKKIDADKAEVLIDFAKRWKLEGACRELFRRRPAYLEISELRQFSETLGPGVKGVLKGMKNRGLKTGSGGQNAR